MSKIVETALDKKHREYVDDADKADEHMQERSLEEDEPYKIPKGIYRTKVETRDMFGCQMVIFNEVEDSERLVIYLHGGIYVNEIKSVHINFCDKLAKKVNASVFAPIYPLAPNHTYEEMIGDELENKIFANGDMTYCASYDIIDDLNKYFGFNISKGIKTNEVYVDHLLQTIYKNI